MSRVLLKSAEMLSKAAKPGCCCSRAGEECEENGSAYTSGGGSRAVLEASMEARGLGLAAPGFTGEEVICGRGGRGGGSLAAAAAAAGAGTLGDKTTGAGRFAEAGGGGTLGDITTGAGRFAGVILVGGGGKVVGDTTPVGRGMLGDITTGVGHSIADTMVGGGGCKL